MKIAITADLHMQSKKLDDIRRGWEELITQLINNKIPCLLIGGDIFSNYNIAGREASFGTVYSALAKPLRKYKRAGGYVYAIPGNHDIAGQNQRDALVSLEEIVTVVRETIGMDIGTVEDRVRVQFLPWLYNNALHHEQLIPKAKAGYYNILLGHCEVSGTQINSHYAIPVGGHFELPKEAFIGKGYDYTALGHIHKRMDYYIGAPWQLTFGEEGNRPGFVVLDINNGKAIETWIDLTSVPQYHTYTANDTTRPLPATIATNSTDYIKIKYAGEWTQSEVGNNVTLEKISTQGTIRARTDVTTNSSVRDMVVAWHKDQDQQNTPSVDDILRIAGEYFTTADSALSVGSIGFIESIRINNVGPHTDTYIDFTAQGINGQKYFALSGHNGSGKTFAIDSIFATLFGVFPSRAGSVYEHIRQGCDETASIGIVFRSRGKRYSAQRKFNNKKRQEAILVDLETSKRIAGPKISDFEREIHTLVGSDDVVIASVFSAQKGVGDIVEAEPTKRKDILWQILNIKNLVGISEDAQQKACQLKAGIDAWNRRIEDLNAKNPAKSLEDRSQETNQLDSRINTLRRQITSYVQDIKQITEEGQKLSAVIAASDAAKKSLSEILKEVSSLHNEIGEILERQAAAKACLRSEPAVIARQKEINAAKSEYQSLQVKYEENLKMEAQIATIHGQISVEKSKISQEDCRIKNEVKSIRQEIDAARVEYDNLIASYLSTLKIHEGNQANLNKAGCNKQPLPCPFINEAIASKDKAMEVKTQINRTKEVFSNKCKDAERRIKELSVLLEQESFAKDARTRILELQKETKGLVLHVIPEDRLTSLKKVVESEGETVSALQKIASAKEALADLEKRLKQKSDEADSKKAKAVEIEREINANKQAAERYQSLKKRWESTTKAKDEAQNQLTEASASRAALAERIKQFEKELAEITTLSQNVEAAEMLKYKANTVARAFGKNGIPQLLIDSALPQIQDILNNLLTQLENKFTIRFATQQETQGGNIKEAIDILAGDELGERDIGNFSGGEQKLLKSVIRIALAVFQAQRHGSRYEVLIIDEVFDALDRDNALKVLQILYMLKDRFQQIIVVSHTDDLLLEFPVRLNFTKTHKGSTYSLVA